MLSAQQVVPSYMAVSHAPAFHGVGASEKPVAGKFPSSTSGGVSSSGPSQTANSGSLESQAANSLATASKKNEDSVLINIGSRKSKLAIKQSEIVSDAILANFPHFETKITSVSTLGDNVQDKPLYSFGGKSVWTKELETLLYESVAAFDRIDIIVHSLKDLPTNLPEGFELGCILKREDPRDALVLRTGSPYRTLADLPAGSIIGTSSVRRSAQLLHKYPHLQFQSVRGNIHTRLQKLDAHDSPYAGILLASAGLIRMDLASRISQYMDQDLMYHAVGQGALGVEIRANDEFIKSICNTIRDDNATFCCLAERAMLRFLEGGCSVPIGCFTNYDDVNNILDMNAVVVSVDGTQFIEAKLSGKVQTDEEADLFGQKIGEKLIANGALKILEEIDYDKINQIKAEGLN